jgi:hypothetical protein
MKDKQLKKNKAKVNRSAKNKQQACFIDSLFYYRANECIETSVKVK